MNRRYFISITAFTAATVTIPFLSCNNINESDKQLSVPQTLSLLTDEKTIIAIGKSFGRTNPEEYSVSTLKKILKAGQQRTAVNDRLPDKGTFALIEKKVQDDFTSGNTIIVNGWVIALTEARQCALYSLITPTK